MKVFLTSAERRAYLGFDDRYMMLIGIPTVSLLAFFFVAPTRMISNPGATTIFACLTISFLYTVVYWACMRTVVIALRQRSPFRENTKLRLATTVGILFVVIVGVKLIEDSISLALRSPEYKEVLAGEPPFLMAIAMSMVLCVMMIAIYESVYYFKKYQDGLLAQERLAKVEMQSQLVSLRDQVNPHFLFNSLNTLTSLIPEDPKLATRFVQRLSAVYRRVLEHADRETVTLAEELVALEDYLFLMRARFEDKLQVEILIDQQARQQQLVPLALQMLAENAIKHNIVSRERPLLLTVVAEPNRVLVTNNLQLRAIKEDSTGIGLTNIRDRYRLLGYDGVRIDESETHYQVEVPLIQVKTMAHVEA